MSRLSSPRLSRATPHGAIAVIVAVVAFLAVAPLSADASAYSKPKTGSWKAPSYFTWVKGGSAKIKKKGKSGVQLKKLKLKLGDAGKQGCGVNSISLRKAVTIKRFKQFSGRWAIGKAKGGLIVGKGGVKLKQGKKKVKGALKLIFDRDGKLATSGLVETKQCSVSFYIRK